MVNYTTSSRCVAMCLPDKGRRGIAVLRASTYIIRECGRRKKSVLRRSNSIFFIVIDAPSFHSPVYVTYNRLCLCDTRRPFYVWSTMMTATKKETFVLNSFRDAEDAHPMCYFCGP